MSSGPTTTKQRKTAVADGDDAAATAAADSAAGDGRGGGGDGDTKLSGSDTTVTNKEEKPSSSATKRKKGLCASDDIVKVNVGGRVFTTLKSRLITKSNFFRDMWEKDDEDEDGDEDSEIDYDDPPTSADSIFLDQSPGTFEVLLDYIRSGKIEAGKLTVNVLLLAEYLGLQDLIQDIKIVSIQHAHAEGKGPKPRVADPGRDRDCPKNANDVLDILKEADFERYKMYQTYRSMKKSKDDDGWDSDDERDTEEDYKTEIELFDELYGPSLEDAIDVGFLPQNIRPDILEYAWIKATSKETEYEINIPPDSSDGAIGRYMESTNQLSSEKEKIRDICRVLQREPGFNVHVPYYTGHEIRCAVDRKNFSTSHMFEPLECDSVAPLCAPTFFDAVQTLQLCGYTELFNDSSPAFSSVANSRSKDEYLRHEVRKLWFYRRRNRSLCRGNRKGQLDSIVSTIVFPSSDTERTNSTSICKEFVYIIRLTDMGKYVWNGLFTTFGDECTMTFDREPWMDEESSVTLAYSANDMNDMISWAKTRGFTTHEPLLERFARYIKWSTISEDRRIDCPDVPDAQHFDLDVCVLSRPLKKLSGPR